jgi:hypothetical protein
VTSLAPLSPAAAQYVAIAAGRAINSTMDLKVIAEKQLVERYLVGRLPPPEARFFEQLVRESPDLADQLGLPDTLKRTMKLLDDTGTEWREQPPRFWHAGWVPITIGAAALLATILAITAYVARSGAEARYRQLRVEAESGLLPAPTNTRTLRIPVARPDARAETYSIGTRAAPTLADLRLNISYATGTVYALVLKRDDGTYWGRIDNLLRDSNGDLRVTLNSAVFAAGIYDTTVEASNLRGETRPAGHLRLRVDAN